MAAATSSKAYRIGMFGGGVVGGGTYELIQKINNQQQQQRSSNHRRIDIVKICVKDITKPRDFRIDNSVTTFTTNPDDILNDKSLDCVVEVMGGAGGLAKTVVTSALKQRKSVVTANKALLAQHLDELNQLSIDNQCPLAYEAAVCGGIPIIHVLRTSCYAGDTIHSICGICNGTTNYMLDKMGSGYEYDKALKEAQDLGYAEADPTADVEGHDVMAKICLLAKLAFGTTIPVDVVPCKGISSIESSDFQYSSKLNCTIKLLGSATISKDNKVSVYVTPVMVPLSNVLASIRGSGNAVLVNSQNMGAGTTCAYTGPGAGRYPTANSVVADIVRLADANNSSGSTTTATTVPSKPFPLQTSYELDMDYTGSFYVRCSDEAAAAAAAATKLGIELIGQKETEFIVTADGCKLSQVQELAKEVQSPMFMPILKS